eukprot:gb/GECG01004360.1/.p1 GENE.gb/GECG01004360.1/~~gb/GECG01004360.1/.p1  ORF type:complete len:108 (+),score=2.74 gb/GECG01004360.1/:1-324(+)
MPLGSEVMFSTRGRIFRVEETVHLELHKVVPLGSVGTHRVKYVLHLLLVPTLVRPISSMFAGWSAPASECRRVSTHLTATTVYRTKALWRSHSTSRHVYLLGDHTYM